MLLLKRHYGQTIIIGKESRITIKVLKINEDKVLLGIGAEQQIPILRGELYNRIQEITVAEEINLLQNSSE